MKQERAERERAKQEREKQEREKQERIERERAERERAAEERAEQKLQLKQLKPVDTSYHRDLRCMEGTRQSLLNQSRLGCPRMRARRMKVTQSGSTAYPESAKRP